MTPYNLNYQNGTLGIYMWGYLQVTSQYRVTIRYPICLLTIEPQGLGHFGS